MAELTAVEQLKEWVADNLQTLQAAKFESIVGEYSGDGNEGNWGGVCFEPAGAWKHLDEKLRNEIGELMDAHVELAAEEYEEGDGGGGEIKLIVSSGQLLHSAYNFETVRAYGFLQSGQLDGRRSLHSQRLLRKCPSEELPPYSPCTRHVRAACRRGAAYYSQATPLLIAVTPCRNNECTMRGDPYCTINVAFMFGWSPHPYSKLPGFFAINRHDVPEGIGILSH
jgi:hypothetical protein